MHFLRITDFDDWRTQARAMLAAECVPAELSWQDACEPSGLFDDLAPATTNPSRPSRETSSPTRRVPPDFIELARKVSYHTDAARWNLLYRVLWRLTHGEPRLLELAVDEDVGQLTTLEKAVRRDAHKAKAFVRFHRQEIDGREQYLAWHRADHRILKIVAPFFSRRFGDMAWTVMTPWESASWDKEQLRYGPGADFAQAPIEDELVAVWKTYYASTFNPARLKVKTMQREMPRRYWATMPETELIPDLIANAGKREQAFVEQSMKTKTTARDFFPATRTLPALREAALHCQGCKIHENATQTVFGEGPPNARLVFVGEQPGDKEDLAGHPFVGPAGQLFERFLTELGIERDEVYLTNTVKHFKWKSNGGRRDHHRASASEIVACRPWLEAELQQIQPQMLVCLGATAAQALLGGTFRITQQRGEVLKTDWAPWTMATYHPSAILRAKSAPNGAQMEEEFRKDLEKVAREFRKKVSGG